MWFMIVTPRNVLVRLFASMICILGGFQIIAAPGGNAGTAIMGLLLVALGAAIGLFALRWFWRLFIVAWFR